MGRGREMYRQKSKESTAVGQIARRRGPQIPLKLARELGIPDLASERNLDTQNAQSKPRGKETESSKSSSKKFTAGRTAQVSVTPTPWCQISFPAIWNIHARVSGELEGEELCSF
jgi:hypothetical protein